MPESGYHLALVGASSLLGREVKEALEARSFPTRRLSLLDDDEALGQLTEFQGEPTFIRTVNAESFAGAEVAIFSSTPAFTRANWKLASAQGCHVIDLSYALEEEPAARLHAPILSFPGPRPPAPDPRVSVSPHPAALAVAAVLERVAARFALSRAVVNIFEPASERGRAGVEELHQQTISLLSFKKVPQEVFDRQLAFDLLASGGAHMRPTLEEVEERVDRHVAALLGGRVPRPSLRVAQAATFHGHSFSFYLEMEAAVPAAEMAAALEGEGMDLRPPTQDAPSAVGAAGSDDIVIGDLRVDRACPRGFWLWAAADNLRLLARNAVCIAEEAVRTPPRHRGTEPK